MGYLFVGSVLTILTENRNIYEKVIYFIRNQFIRICSL